MSNTTTQELYKKLILKLLDAKWIEKNEFNEDFIKNHVENLYFINKVNSLVEKNDYSCRGVLSLCQSMMAELAGENPPADWLHYVYQYALHKSFPHAVEIELSPSLNSFCELYLRVLSVFDEFQKSSGDGTWQSKYPVEYLTEEEERSLENPWEYDKFIEAFEGDYIYEMMKLHQELTGHNTLDHICGVHSLALFIGRQLYRAGLPVDLGRVSGAAAGHDIGKYGCSRAELKRVPYLHYYYTDYWFKKYDITYIRHIAVNHSTWDLELENLPIESLILIYADFRVKNQISTDNKYEMHIFNLDESFDVILQKLDNVDTAKEKRYKRVYAKLKDFENYMIHLGVNVDIHFSNKIYISDTKLKYNYSLMQGEEILNNFKYLSMEHNIMLMHKLRDEYSLNLILEQARSQKDWKKLREYIQIFEEYSTYLTQKQKLIMIKFLYEQLTRKEDDIRRQCAELMGIIIAMFDEDYRKEIPENAILEKPEITSTQLFDKYIQLFITPDHRIIPTHRTWIGSSLSIMISSLFSHCRKRQINDYRNVLLKYYSNNIEEEDVHIFLLEAAKYIPVSHDSETISPLFDYVLHIFKNQNNVLKLSSQEVILTFIQELKYNHPFRLMLNEIFSGDAPKLESPPENYLNLKIARLLNVGEDIITTYESNFNESMNMISDIFL
jgi:HD superfamily phosphodiesterase